MRSELRQRDTRLWDEVVALRASGAAQAREIAALRGIVTKLVEELDDPSRASWISDALSDKARASMRDWASVEMPYQLADAVAEIAALQEALERISVLSPNAANARDARDLHLTVRAIAETALARSRPLKGNGEGASDLSGGSGDG